MPIIQGGMYKNYEEKDDKGTMVTMTGKNQKRLHVGVHIRDGLKKMDRRHLLGDGRKKQKGSGQRERVIVRRQHQVCTGQVKVDYD